MVLVEQPDGGAAVPDGRNRDERMSPGACHAVADLDLARFDALVLLAVVQLAAEVFDLGLPRLRLAGVGFFLGGAGEGGAVLLRGVLDSGSGWSRSTTIGWSAFCSRVLMLFPSRVGLTGCGPLPVPRTRSVRKSGGRGPRAGDTRLAPVVGCCQYP